MYKVLVNNRCVFTSNSYETAAAFQAANGGCLYEHVGSWN